MGSKSLLGVGMLLYFSTTGDRTGLCRQAQKCGLGFDFDHVSCNSCHAMPYIFCAGPKKSSIDGNWNGIFIFYFFVDKFGMVILCVHKIDYSFILCAIECLSEEK